MQLHEELLVLRKQEKNIGSQIIEKLQCLEVRRQYLGLGYSSLFDYLVRGLSYSEGAAYQKQSCVRLTKELPEIKAKLDSGVLTTTGFSMAFKTLRRKSTSEKRELLKKIENKRASEIKQILLEQELAPPVKIQKTEYQNKVILRLELSKEQNSKLEKLKALTSHQGDIAKLFENLIDKELKKYANTKFKQTSAKDSKFITKSKDLQLMTKPKGPMFMAKSKNPRFIAKTLRNHTLEKANYSCEYLGCESTYYLQVDHITPVRLGGKPNLENLQILCGAHNRAKG